MRKRSIIAGRLGAFRPGRLAQVEPTPPGWTLPGYSGDLVI
jgi:hypothetical protein